MRQTLFLLSNSTVFGMQYLEHALESLKDFLSDERRLLFVPYALADYDGYYSWYIVGASPAWRSCQRSTYLHRSQTSGE
jgi:peptidase E